MPDLRLSRTAFTLVTTAVRSRGKLRAQLELTSATGSVRLRFTDVYDVWMMRLALTQLAMDSHSVMSHSPQRTVSSHVFSPETYDPRDRVV